MRRRWAVVALVLICSFSSVLLARPGVVVTKDGNSFDGDVAEDNDAGTVTIVIHSVPYKVKKANVESIVYADEVDADVHAKAAALRGNDVKGRLALAQYAMDHHALPAARDVLLQVLRIDPQNPDARDQLERVNALIKAQAPASPTATATQPTTGPATAPAVATSRPTPTAELEGGVIRAVTADEINVIRQSELRDGDNVRVKLEPDLRRRFAEYMSMPLADFNKLSAMQQAVMVLDKGKPDMKKEVKILSDPLSLSVFRKDVNKFMVAGCATSKCHGGSSPGKFKLFPQGDNEASIYSNFIILQKYSTGFKGQKYVMVDRQNPDASLLLNYMLPPELADVPHPETKAYRGAVRNRTDVRLTSTVKWIRDDLTPVAPDYSRIDLTRPAPTPEDSRSAGAGRDAPVR